MPMPDLDRRSALVFGITAASTPVLPHAVEAGTSGMSGSSAMSQATEGTEVYPGVRRIEYGSRASMIPAYKAVSMRDMVYHMLEGELAVNQGPGMDFVFTKGNVWVSRKGMPESHRNTGSSVAIMR